MDETNRKIVVLSDIHANLEAFEAVLEDMKSIGPADTYCLGDSVGYGPDPEKVVNIIRKRGIPTVMGNHERGLSRFCLSMPINPLARTSLRKTRHLVSRSTLKYSRNLPPFLVDRGCRFVHGSPPDNISRYLFEITPTEMADVFHSYPERTCFAGHTHELDLITFDGKRARHIDLAEGMIKLDPDLRHIVNVGSVGQPRDGIDNRAKYVIFDPDKFILEVRFVGYDVERTVDKILRAGLPKSNALRLK